MHASDARSSRGGIRTWAGVRFGRRLVDSRSARIGASPAAVFAAVEGIGGRRGWYFGNWLWQLRGFLDLLVGGAGMRRGRRDPSHLSVGDCLDCWRVEEKEPGRLLCLQAEMKLPGRAWLQFEVPPERGGSRLSQTAVFDPLGVAGHLYWYALYPIHVWLFGGMLRGVGEEAAGADRALAGECGRGEAVGEHGDAQMVADGVVYLRRLFAQSTNLLKPSFHRMLHNIRRSRREAPELAAPETAADHPRTVA